LNKSAFKFGERDSQILLTLYKHRFLTITQIQLVHFPSLQTSYRRMRILREAGLVASFTVPGIAESIFAVARKGMTTVAASLGIDPAEMKWTDIKTKPKDYYFMRHFLAINDFRIALAAACDWSVQCEGSVPCENSRVKLLGFIPDYYGEKTAGGSVTKYLKDVICDIAAERQEVSHTPDSAFALEKNGKTALFFLEIDRGTEVVSNMNKGVLKSLRFYMNYLLDGKYQRYAKDFRVESFKGFRSLYVTTSEIRVQNIREATRTLNIPPKAKRFHWITTFETLSKNNVFDPVWRSIDSGDQNNYSIAGS